ncbi:leucyl/phenylalanyl-tRNA--protein transferase [uncultured Mesonia sp.]|uniref:leucyl/phenylalanyl-tRNA--protein transferase n=1 Tax=uncultured Mesonia sp. TaxID=399731 RepID=UPI00374FA87A
MSIPFLDTKQDFPHPNTSNELGLVAYGGHLTPERILRAYKKGIFPWYENDQPVLWWSPNPRMVLFPKKLKVSKSMRKLLDRKTFKVTFNEEFEQVIQACAQVKRPGQNGTWITKDIINAYTQLHQQGFAYSVEVWQNERLVGGLYGIWLKPQRVFCGESMFSLVSNASKYAFITWVQFLKEHEVSLIDCQVHTNHLASLGAEEIDRQAFLSYL